MSELTNLFSGIADAIRAKKGTESEIAASDFPSEIMSISTGSAPTGTKTVNVTANGTRTEDVSGYANVEINTNVPTYAPTANKEFYITTNTGRIDASVLDYASVSIIVNVPTSSSSGYYAIKMGSSYPIPFYYTNDTSEYLYFAEMDATITNFNEVIVVENTAPSAGRILAKCSPNAVSAGKWEVFNTNGTLAGIFKLNGNKIPLKMVSANVEIYAVK